MKFRRPIFLGSTPIRRRMSRVRQPEDRYELYTPGCSVRPLTRQSPPVAQSRVGVEGRVCGVSRGGDKFFSGPGVGGWCGVVVAAHAVGDFASQAGPAPHPAGGTPSLDHRLVGVGEVGDRRWQCVDDMEVGHGQQFRFPVLEPVARRRPLTLGTMAVATTVVGDDGVAAFLFLTARNMPAERRRAAALDGADITFTWARLTWPRLASRHAPP